MDTNLYVIDLLTGHEVEPGDRVISFRGEPAVLVEPLAPREPGHSGYVAVRWIGESEGSHRYYDNVFNLAVLLDG